MEKKHPILQKLDNYLSNVSEEQLQKDWKELKQYQEIGGPTMMEVLAPHPTIGIAECGSQYSQFNSIDEWAICWNDMSDEDKADFFIASTNLKK